MTTGEPAPNSLTGELAEHWNTFEDQLAQVSDRESWDALRLQWIGRKQGLVRSLLSHLKDIAPEDRRAYGQGANVLKEHVEKRLADADAEITRSEKSDAHEAAAVDVSLPGRAVDVGSVHPVNLVIQEVVEIFKGLGYSVAEGPEIEDDYHNFEALNFPPGHPARDEQDTFFLEDGRLLRTHTSPVQIRTMLERKPPIRVICPGRVYRHDNDLTHSPMFHQIECLVVDEGITFGHLKGTLEAFLTKLFHPETKVRFRPSFFPFTEPSAEVDISCPFCGGDGCGTCSQTGWMEILGSGMVDPRVLAGCDIDPEIYSGFAFGMGMDRVAMNRFGIPNIKVLFNNDERLLRQVKG